MGKNRRIKKGGGTKNSNKCSVLPATYKLDYLPTNFILNHSNKNSNKPSKIKHFTHFNHLTSISHPISSNPTKINTSTHLKPQSKTTIQITFFLYKYENPKKIPIFTDYQLFIKNHINNIKKFTLISNSKREYKNVIKITVIKTFKLKKEITL